MAKTIDFYIENMIFIIKYVIVKVYTRKESEIDGKQFSTICYRTNK